MAPQRTEWLAASAATIGTLFLAVSALEPAAMDPSLLAQEERSPEAMRELTRTLLAQVQLDRLRVLDVTWSSNARARGRVSIGVRLARTSAHDPTRADGDESDLRQELLRVCEILVRDPRLAGANVLGLRVEPSDLHAAGRPPGTAAASDGAIQLLLPREAFERFPWPRASGDDLFELAARWGGLRESAASR